MDHIKVLKRAFEITWRYRVLWVFGIILALTAGGGGGGSNPSSYQFGGGGGNGNGGNLPPGQIEMPHIPTEVVWAIVALVAALVCVVLILIVVGTIARYVSETALIRMVDDHEETGEKRSVRQGFRLGWTRAAWRFFLMDLLIAAAVIVGVFAMLVPPVLLLTVLALPAALLLSPVVLIVVAAVGAFFLSIFLFIIVGLVLSGLTPFFRRVCALESVGVLEAICLGFQFVKRHLKDVAIMWLLMIGLGFAWLFAMIPVALLLVLAGVVAGSIPALTIAGLAGLVLEGAWPWVAGGVVGLLIFIVVVAVPSLFLSGLAEVFKSSVWTLTYRELRTLEGLEMKPELLPEA